jgi:GNAT superfamily N-acetyltransferase
MDRFAERIYAELGLTADEVARLPHEIGELRTVEEDGATAGDVWLELRGPALHVHALLLEPRFRARGIGGRVLSELEDEFPGPNRPDRARRRARQHRRCGSTSGPASSARASGSAS